MKQYWYNLILFLLYCNQQIHSLHSKLDQNQVITSQSQISQDILENNLFDFKELQTNHTNNIQNTLQYFQNSIGPNNYAKFISLFDPLGTKWKSKILAILHNFPNTTSNQHFKQDYRQIENEYQKFIRTKNQFQHDTLKFNFKEYEKQTAFMFGEKPVEKLLDFIEEAYQIDIVDIFSEQMKEHVSKIDPFDFRLEDKTITEGLEDKILEKFKKTYSFKEEDPSLANWNIVEEWSKNVNPFKVNIDEEPPAPNSPTQSDVNCFEAGTCMAYQLESQVCTLIRIVVRMIFEIVSTIFHIVVMIIMILCVCIPKKAPMYYIGMDTMTCNNTKAQPGLICVIPFAVVKVIYALLFVFEKILILVSGKVCMLPIG